MTQYDRLRELFLRKGVLSLTDDVCAEFPRAYFSRLTKAGFIHRIGAGVYSCPDYSSSEHITSVEAASVLPQGVLCLFSALKFHELTVENPHYLHVAIPRGLRVPKNNLPLRLYRFSRESYSFGIENVTVKDGVIKVYSVEKTIADLFKFRNIAGLDVAIAALKEAKVKGVVNQDKLWRAIDVCRVEKIMMPYLEGVFA